MWLKRFLISVLLLVMALISIGQDCDENDDGLDIVQTHQLQVRNHILAFINDAAADQIIDDMAEVLQTDDGANDIACGVDFARSGNVTSFVVVPGGSFMTNFGILATNADVTAVNALPGNIKVVTQIQACGGLVSPNIIGCAPVPGNSLVVVRFTAAQEGILWAHEFGHNQGLGHRNANNAVMNATINANRTGVTNAECTSFTAP